MLPSHPHLRSSPKSLKSLSRQTSLGSCSLHLQVKTVNHLTLAETLLLLLAD